MITNKEKQLFFRFLKNHDVYSKYIYNIKYIGLRINGTINFNVFYRINTPYHLIDQAFGWNRSKESYVFWSKINNQWKTMLNENKM